MATQISIIRGELAPAAAGYPITRELGSNHHLNEQKLITVGIIYCFLGTII